MKSFKKIIGLTLMSALFFVGNAYGLPSFRRSKTTSAPKPATPSRWGSFKAKAAQKWTGAKARTRQAGTRFGVRTGFMKKVPESTQSRDSRWKKPKSGAANFTDDAAKLRQKREADASKGGLRGWLAGGSLWKKKKSDTGKSASAANFADDAAKLRQKGEADASKGGLRGWLAGGSFKSGGKKLMP